MRKFPHFLVFCVTSLVATQAWGADEPSEGEKSRSLAEFLSSLGDQSLKIVVLPLDLVAPYRNLEKQAKSEDFLAETIEEIEADADPDSALLNQQNVRPFIPATMFEGELTTKLDVASEVERLRKTAPRRPRTSRSPSGTLLAVLRENQIERERLQQETDEPTETMIASRSSSDTNSAKPQKEENPPFVLLAMLRKDDEEKSSNEGVKGPKLAFLLARNPNRARTSRGAEGESQSPNSEAPDATISQLTASGKNLEFLTIGSTRAPLHVFDVDPTETFRIELDEGEVGRVQDQGKEWAWIQLDSGLMGVMRNQHLRPASREEVLQFLALESPGAGEVPYEMSASVLQLNLDVSDFANAISEAGESLHGVVMPKVEGGENTEKAPEPQSSNLE